MLFETMSVQVISPQVVNIVNFSSIRGAKLRDDSRTVHFQR